MDEYRLIIKNNFRKYRLRKHHLTQQALCNLANVSPSTYLRLERGVAYPSFLALLKICKVLDIELNDILRQDISLSKVIQFEKISKLRPTYPQINVKSRIGIIRRNLKRNKTTIANLAGISIDTYTRVEKGQCIPHITTALKIAHAFNMKLDEVFILEGRHDWFENKRRYSRKLMEEKLYEDLINP